MFDFKEGEPRLALIIVMIVAAIAAAIIILSHPEVIGWLEGLPVPACQPGLPDALQTPLGVCRP